MRNFLLSFMSAPIYITAILSINFTFSPIAQAEKKQNYPQCTISSFDYNPKVGLICQTSKGFLFKIVKGFDDQLGLQDLQPKGIIWYLGYARGGGRFPDHWVSNRVPQIIASIYCQDRGLRLPTAFPTLYNSKKPSEFATAADHQIQEAFPPFSSFMSENSLFWSSSHRPNTTAPDWKKINELPGSLEREYHTFGFRFERQNSEVSYDYGSRNFRFDMVGVDWESADRALGICVGPADQAKQ